jgi:two-component system KDP operon response regulator KdpE
MDAQVFERRTSVLVLTGEPGLVRLTRSILEPDRRVIAGGPFDANALAGPGQADVVVVDLHAIDRDALAAAQRAYPGAAVIALCAEPREADCIAALEMGADYLPRPFSATDLAARVRVAELKRFAATGRPRFYRNGPLAFDLFSGKLSIDGEAVQLAPSELVLLAHLAGRAGAVVAHERLITEAGLAGLTHGRPALRSCVMHLRRKIEPDPLHPEILLAEIGVGYRLASPTADPSRRPRDCLPNDPQ